MIFRRLSEDEQACESHYATTHTRDEQGRYCVRLPFKQSPERLGDSKSKAVRIINKLYDTFERKSAYFHAYSEFISEYEKLHHMQLVSEEQLEPHSKIGAVHSIFCTTEFVEKVVLQPN